MLPPAAPPLAIDHWRAVGDVISRLLSPSRTGLLREAGWPAVGMGRTTAFEAVRQARQPRPQLADLPAGGLMIDQIRPERHLAEVGRQPPE